MKTNSKEIFKMSIPIFMELLLQLLVGNIDQIMVSRYSQASVAAIGNGNQIMNIIIIVLSSMSVATTILITQYMGANDRTKTNIVSNVSVYCLSLFSIVVTGLLFICNRKLFSWLEVPNEIMDETCNYTLVVGSFIIVQALYMVVAAILRSFNKMKEIMFVAIIMNSLNILGNAVLINGLFGFPRLGILGAAISTDISKLIGLILIIIILLKKTDMSFAFLKLKHFSSFMAKKLMFIALPSGGESLSYNLSQLCILKFVNILGTLVIATRVYCYILANIAYVYSNAISQATQIVVSYLMGKGDYDTVEKRVWASTFISMAVSVTVTVLLYLNCDFVMSMFTDEQFIIDLAKDILIVEIFLEIGRSVNITMVKCLVATGDINLPVTVCMFSAWFVAVGLSYVFGVLLGWGLVGIWIAMAMDECLRAIIFVFRFKSGKFRETKVI